MRKFSEESDNNDNSDNNAEKTPDYMEISKINKTVSLAFFSV